MLGTKLLGLLIIIQVLQLQINGTVLRIRREPSPLNTSSNAIDALLSKDASAKDELAKDASAKATNGTSSQDEKHDTKAANNEASELEVSLKEANETNAETNTKHLNLGNNLTLNAQVSSKPTSDAVLNEEISSRNQINKAKVEAKADDGFFHQPVDSDENLSVELEEAVKLEEEEKELKQKGVVEKQGGEEAYVNEALLKTSKVEVPIDDGFFHQPVDSDENLSVQLEEAVRLEEAEKELKQKGVVVKQGGEEAYVNEALLKTSKVEAPTDDGFFHQPIESFENLAMEMEKADQLEDGKETKQNEVVLKSGSETNAGVNVDESLLKAASNTETVADDKQDGVGGKNDSEKYAGTNVDKTLMNEQSNVKAKADDGFFHQPIDSDENLSIELEEVIRLEEEEKENKQKGVSEKHGGEGVNVNEALLKGASEVEAATDDDFFHQTNSKDEKLATEIKDATNEKEMKQNGVKNAKSGGETNAEVFTDESSPKAASNKEVVADDKQGGVGGKSGSEVNVDKTLFKARSNVNAMGYDGFFHQPLDSDENLTFELEEAIRLEEEAKEMKRNGVGEKSDSEDDGEVYIDESLLKETSKATTDEGPNSDENLSLVRDPPKSQIRFLDEYNHKVAPKNIFIIPENNADVINLSIFTKPPNQAIMDQLKEEMAKQNLESLAQVAHHKTHAKKSFKSRDSLNFHIPDFVTLKKLLHNSEIYLRTEEGIYYDYPCTIKEGDRFVCKPKSASTASKRHGNFQKYNQNPKKKYWKHQGYNGKDIMLRHKSDSHKHANGHKAHPIVLKSHGYQHEPWMKSKYY